MPSHSDTVKFPVNRAAPPAGTGRRPESEPPRRAAARDAPPPQRPTATWPSSSPSPPTQTRSPRTPRNPKKAKVRAHTPSPPTHRPAPHLTRCRPRAGCDDDRACCNCGKVGHLSRDCPSAGDGSGDGFGGSASRGCSSSAGKACYNCGEFGHISRDCPKPSQGLAARVSVLAAAVVKLVACLATGSRRQQWQQRQLRQLR